MLVCMSYFNHINCTHCSMTLVDCVELPKMVDWRMSRSMSRMEWTLMKVLVFGLVAIFIFILHYYM